MSRSKIWLMAAFLLLGRPAGAVSRVGTGKLTNQEVGFSTDTPKGFVASVISPNSDVLFDGGMMMSGGSFQPRPLRLVANLLANAQPRWVGHSDRKEFRDYYLALGWISIPHPNPCVEALQKENASSLNVMMSWGDGRGLILAGESQYPPVTTGIEQMTQALTLYPGACAWK